MEALCLWKTFARGKIKSVRKSSEKKPDAKKKERVPLCQVKKKNPLWKRLVLAELSRWLPDFEQRSRCQSKFDVHDVENEVTFSLCKYQPWYKTSTIASNRNFKAVCRFVVLLLSSFCGFSIFAAGFSFAFGNFARYCNVLLNAPLSDRDKKKVFEMGYFSREILIRRHWRQEVLSSYWFAVSGGEIISWRGASCLRTFMS